MQEHVYEQTFFTDRAPGDESHLLKWYEPVTRDQKQWIADELNKSIDDPKMKWVVTKNGLKENNSYAIERKIKTGQEAYQFATIQAAVIAKSKNGREFPRLASEFLARAGIDGVKYPVDSYGGKGVKDGDKVGWNYVSFRDDNIRVDHKWADGVARFSARPAMSALAKAKVGESVEGTTVDSLRNAIKTKIENGLSEGEFRFKKPEDRAKLVSEAVRFYKRFSQKTVMLSDGRCVYFVPDARAKAERGLSNDEAWAEYAIHAVTSSGQKIPGKDWNERLFNKTKAANIWRIENILKAERCKLQEETEDRKAGIAFYGKGVDGKVIRIITRLDEADNIYADLAEVTVVTDRKEKVLPPRKPLAEVVGAARKRGDLPTDDKGIVSQNAASSQGVIKLHAGVDQIASRQFKEWFGKSKVVNRAGQPQVVYHGTPNGKFWTFDKNRVGETWGADETGFFFTSSKALAEDYTKPYFKESSADPNLFSVYLSIQNPLVIDRAWWQKNFGRSDIHRHDAVEIWDKEQRTILDAMREGGHDGVIIDPNPMAGEPKMYMVPEPNQIKSATDNIGTFDSGNNDVRFHAGARNDWRDNIWAD